MYYEIFDEEGNIINRIVADKNFVNKKYPNRYKEIFKQPALVPLVISKVAFRFRLTDLEYSEILSAAKTDTEVQAWVETFNMVSKIDLESQKTIDGMSMMVTKELLSSQRANEILSTPVEESERPEGFTHAIYI